MMGAVQPFLSGAISKTVNMPEEATVEEIEAAAPAVVGARPEGRRRSTATTARSASRCRRRRRATHAEPAPAAAARRAGDAGGRADRRADRPPADPPEAAAHRVGAHVRVPRRRLQGLRQRSASTRTVVPARSSSPCRSRARRCQRDHGRVRQEHQLRPAVRRADAGVRRGVHQHALRAGRHDRRPRHPLRLVDHGLPVPPPRARVHDLRRARRARHLLDRRAAAADAARRRGERRSRRRRAPRSSPTRRASRRRRSSPRRCELGIAPPAPNNDVTNPGGVARPAVRQSRRADVHAVRRADEPRRLAATPARAAAAPAAAADAARSTGPAATRSPPRSTTPRVRPGRRRGREQMSITTAAAAPASPGRRALRAVRADRRAGADQRQVDERVGRGWSANSWYATTDRSG